VQLLPSDKTMPKPPEKSKRWLILLLGFFATGLLIWAYRPWGTVSDQKASMFGPIKHALSNKPSFRDYLPPTAAPVYEWSWSDPMIGDGSYMMKARVNAKEFSHFAKELRLSPHTKTRIYTDDVMWLSWIAAPGSHETWWNPSDKLGSTFVRQDGRSWMYAKHEQGYLFFKQVSH
jgi:hypothetical protein